MTKLNFTNLYRALIAFISAFLLAYVTIRAYVLSFTHDESLSFTIVQGDGEWVNTANNHLLNTNFMSLNESLFGMSELALRLPNVLLFMAYLLGCFFIFRTSNKIWLSILGLILILFNPFLIEFFSIARGYGLSLGFMLLSMYFLIRNNIQNSSSSMLLKDFVLTSLFASFAIYANLAIINFFISILIIFAIKYWVFGRNNNVKSAFKIKFWIVFIIATVPIINGVKRLLKLKEGGQLYFGDSSFKEGFDSLILSSIHHKEYASLIIPTVMIFTASLLLIGLVYVILKKKYNGALFIIIMLIAFLLTGLFLEDYLFDAKYPTSRTALFYIPIISVFIYHLFLEIINQYKIKSKFYIPVIICIVTPILVNFASGINLTHTSSWEFDANTKDAMKVIKTHAQNTDQKLTISNHWLFEPTINFYISRENINLNPANRNGANPSTDFIYRLDDFSRFEGFKVIKTYADTQSQILMKE